MFVLCWCVLLCLFLGCVSRCLLLLLCMLSVRVVFVVFCVVFGLGCSVAVDRCVCVFWCTMCCLLCTML